MRASPYTRAAVVTLGELAEAYSDAATEVCEDPAEATVAGAVALLLFLAGRRSVRSRMPGRDGARGREHRLARGRGHREVG